MGLPGSRRPGWPWRRSRRPPAKSRLTPSSALPGITWTPLSVGPQARQQAGSTSYCRALQVRRLSLPCVYLPWPFGYTPHAFSREANWEYTAGPNCRTLTGAILSRQHAWVSSRSPRSPRAEADPLKGSRCRFESDRGHGDPPESGSLEFTQVSDDTTTRFPGLGHDCLMASGPGRAACRRHSRAPDPAGRNRMNKSDN
jgi:hypothetical protein